MPAPLRNLFRGDPAMHHVVTRAAKLINTQMGLLITGETGTGKEHLTKALHSVITQPDVLAAAVYSP